MTGRIASAVAALLIAAGSSSAQSLGDVARQEEARRAAGTKSVKTLTNANLDPSAIAPPSGAPAAGVSSCYMSIRLARCVSPDEMVANSVAANLAKQNAPFEPKWRDEAHQIRSQIEWAQRSIGNLEAVVADQGRSASDRQAAQQALRTAQLELDGFERQWRSLENRAKTYDVPRAWLEPIPTLPSRVPQQ